MKNRDPGVARGLVSHTVGCERLVKQARENVSSTSVDPLQIGSRFSAEVQRKARNGVPVSKSSGRPQIFSSQRKVMFRQFLFGLAQSSRRCRWVIERMGMASGDNPIAGNIRRQNRPRSEWNGMSE